MNIDPYTRASRAIASRSASVTTHNTNPLPEVADEVYVGTGGNVTLRLEGDTSDRVFKNVPSGLSIYARISYVRTSGTTAADMIAIFYQ